MQQIEVRLVSIKSDYFRLKPISPFIFREIKQIKNDSKKGHISANLFIRTLCTKFLFSKSKIPPSMPFFFLIHDQHIHHSAFLVFYISLLLLFSSLFFPVTAFFNLSLQVDATIFNYLILKIRFECFCLSHITNDCGRWGVVFYSLFPHVVFS